jgi:hypothetical protein
VLETCFHLKQALDGPSRSPIFSIMTSLSMHPAPINKPVRIRPGKRNSLRNVLQLQDALAETMFLLGQDAAHSADASLRARIGSSIAQLARSWDTLENRKRVLRGRPLPGSFKPEKPEPKGYKPWESHFHEPMFTDPSESPQVPPSEPTAQSSQATENHEVVKAGSPDLTYEPSSGAPAQNGSDSACHSPKATQLAKSTPNDGQVMRLGDRISWTILPEGPRVQGIVTKLAQGQEYPAEIRTDDGQIRSFNPQSVPWEHVDRDRSAT